MNLTNVVVAESRGLVSKSDSPAVLSDIYRPGYNLVVWRRELSPMISTFVDHLVAKGQPLSITATVSPNNVRAAFKDILNEPVNAMELIQDVEQLVDMFCCLFDAEAVGLRIKLLDKAMCPKFHVDKIPCRLVTTYQGLSTEWLPHDLADRSKLGLGCAGLADKDSGIYQNPADIQSLDVGDVAIMKGDGWVGNEGAGLIHRSPAVAENEKRLLLTLDLMAE